MTEKTFSLMTRMVHEAPADPRVSFDVFKEVPGDEFRQIQAANKMIREFVDADLLAYVKHAKMLYDQSLDRIARSMLASTVDYDAFRPDRDIACNLLTFVSALRVFNDQTNLKVARKYGKRSVEAQEAARIFSHSYDSHFGYRFCYKLREFITHRSLDAVKVEWRIVEHQNHEEQTRQRTATLGSYVERDTILAESDVYKRALRDEVASLGEKIYVGPLMTQAVDGVRQIARNIRLLLFPGIVECTNILRAAEKHFEGRSGQPILARFPTDGSFTGGSTAVVDSTPLDFGLLREVEALLAGDQSCETDVASPQTET